MGTAVEVWLTRRNINIRCMVVHDDESAEYLDVDSIVMRGAQRETTSHFVSQGYKPVGRWHEEVPGECWRRYRQGPVRATR